MKNKGFTLIELIGTIVILSLIVLVIVPPISSSIKNGAEKADEQTKQSIIMAAKSWVSDNKPAATCCIKVSELESSGYIDGDVTWQSKKEKDNNQIFVKIKKQANNKYEYEYSEECDVTCQ